VKVYVSEVVLIFKPLAERVPKTGEKAAAEQAKKAAATVSFMVKMLVW